LYGKDDLVRVVCKGDGDLVSDVGEGIMCWGLRGIHPITLAIASKKHQIYSKLLWCLQLIKPFDLSYKYKQAIYISFILVAGCDGRCKRRDSYPLILGAVP
jgi:hypothetical protein